MHLSVFMVPDLTLAYNFFINRVDRFDQLRSKNASTGKEKRVPMSIFTFMLDETMHNGFFIGKNLIPTAHNFYIISKVQFKRNWCQELLGKPGKMTTK